VCGLFLCAVLPAQARTVIQFSTAWGAIDVELFDDTMPKSVKNFLTYVRGGRFASSIIHRSTTYNAAGIQIIQGGGFRLDQNSISPIVSEPAVVLESGGPHLRGTLAMARTDQLDSATSQWFFNVTDNPGLNGNYAVFGRVLGQSGLNALDAIAGLPVYDASSDLGGAFSELPLTQNTLAASSLVIVEDIKVVDPNLRTTFFGISEGGFRLDWSTTPVGRAVEIQRTSDLTSGLWVTIAENLSDSSFIDPNPPVGRAFYRVIVP
jgi:cyclophilin family peptidyl-prolyl cis-trans isomerase